MKIALHLLTCSILVSATCRAFAESPPPYRKACEGEDGRCWCAQQQCARVQLAAEVGPALGCAGDDTHGHIDDLTRFVAPGRVVTVVESERSDENFTVLNRNLEILRDSTDAAGRKLEILELPMPAPLYFEGVRLPASYANFYIANSAVLVPTFNDVHDREALAILAACFPDREVIGIHAVDLVLGYGTLHCLTQQQPRV